MLNRGSPFQLRCHMAANAITVTGSIPKDTGELVQYVQ
jgi:hypothetical protein